MSGRGASTAIARAALPLYVSTLAAAAASLVDTALLGRHATVSLAAFAVTVAVFSPAALAVANLLQAVTKTVSFRRHTGRLGAAAAAPGERVWPDAHGHGPDR